MQPIIKWPGGKTSELSKIKPLLPPFERYVEPFFGGGALFFALEPQRAAINDLSRSLVEFYRLIQAQDPKLKTLLLAYDKSFHALIDGVSARSDDLLKLFRYHSEYPGRTDTLHEALAAFVHPLSALLSSAPAEELVLDPAQYNAQLVEMAADKLTRTVINHQKRPFSEADLRKNLVTGFASGFYMYFRHVFNDIQLGRVSGPDAPYRAANFYFIREYCYGSMFRYNKKGEFNIPYGGMSYNEKRMQSKIASMFSPAIAELFARTELSCGDFETFLTQCRLTERDFLFLDPPYDTEFSDYDGSAFTLDDQRRLADFLTGTPARFQLVIKHTDFIHDLYQGRGFHISSFDNRYAYNVRSRNTRQVEHLIITNLPV